MKLVSGFTLIEMLIVLAIVSFLTSVFLPTLQEARAKGEDARRISSAKSLQTEIANQTTAGTTSYATVFTDTNNPIKQKLDKLSADTGLVVRTDFSSAVSGTDFDAYSDATSFALVIPLKTDPTKYWCVDAEGASKQVSGRLTTGAGPKNCNDATVAGGSSPTVIATVTVGSGPTKSVLSGTKLYVANYAGNTVSVVSTVNNTVSSTVYTGNNPSSLHVVGSYIYVTNEGSNTVSVINTATDTVTTNINLLFGFGPRDAVLINTKLYVLNQSASYTNAVSIIETTNNTILGTISIGSAVTQGYLTDIKKDNNKIYISDGYPNNPKVHIVDTSAGNAVSTISLDNTNTGAEIMSIIGTKLYVPQPLADKIAIIDMTNNQIISTLSVGDNPTAGSVLGTNLYINNYGSGTVSVLNTTSGTISGTISVGGNNYYSSVLGGNIYTNNQNSGTVSVINTNTNTVTDTLTVGSNPLYSTIVGTKLYVSNYSSGTVSVIETN